MDSGAPLRFVRNDGLGLQSLASASILRYSPAYVPPDLVPSVSSLAQGFASVPHSRFTLGRAVLVAGLLALALGGCGRKGPLEAPPNVTGAIDLPDAQIGAVERDAESLTQNSILARPPKASRQVTVPEKPFVLDAIL